MTSVTKNDIPSVAAIKGAMLELLASGRSRAFAGVGGEVARMLGLSRAQRAYRIGASKKTLFENRLVQARAELVKEGAITYKAGKVKLARGGTAESAGQQAAAPASGKKSRAPEGRPTMCLSFQEPYASYIVSGVKDAEFRTRKVNVPIRNLVVCASKTPKLPPIPGLAYGYAIGMVDVTDCVPVHGEYAWKLENPRLIKPFLVHATAAFFYVADIPEVVPNTAEAYREHILPLALRGDARVEDEMVASLYSAKLDKVQMRYRMYADKFAQVKPGQ